METSECIKKRRSIRKYTTDPVSVEEITRVLEAARWAPSGGNYQNWKFIAVTNREIIKKMQEASLCAANSLCDGRKEAFRSFRYGTFFNAPVVIAACAKLEDSIFKGKQGKRLAVEELLADNTEIISLGAAIQNMLLEAYNLGLGTCWCRVDYFKRKSMESILGIRRPLVLVANIALGYPAESPDCPRKDLRDISEFII